MPNWRLEAAKHKLLPAIIDELALREPDSLWAEYPSSSATFDDGFKRITNAQFANAVNGCACIITQALGKSDTGEPLGWLAPNNARCTIALVAAIKAGFTRNCLHCPYVWYNWISETNDDPMNFSQSQFETSASRLLKAIRRTFDARDYLKEYVFAGYNQQQACNPQLSGIVILAAFYARSTRQTTLLFISSISATMNFNALGRNTAVPETIISELEATADAGYAETKYLTERLIEHATTRLNIHSTILRLGQIAGSVSTPGRWHPVNWIPALVKSSRELGVIPGSLDAGRPRVLHPLNPNRTSWEAILPFIIVAIESQEPGKPIECVSPDTWITKLRAAASKSLDEGQEGALRANPALRLIDFFQARFGGGTSNGGQLAWETAHAERVSAKLGDAEVIDGEIMGRWTRQWLE
ncbi:hypothetical protein BDW62DRAFT_200335 [Aspergillus aurantiobrunneus]